MSPSLIIKPTERCNFKCTFCSSTNIQNGSEDLDLEYIFRYLDRYPNTPTIIVNGGDPLMMKPDYYWKILEFINNKNLPTKIDFTTNLWAFYKKPDKWIDIFRNEKISVCTSFQYGNGRLKPNLTPLTEKEFLEISDMFMDMVGYRPPFISVISKENENTIIKTVELAKKLDVVCKINYQMASGTKTTFKGITIGSEDYCYTLSDIYEKYIEIYEAGLSKWEHNTDMMINRLFNHGELCPQSRNCDDGIRNLQPGGKYYSCGAFGDDDLYSIDFEYEMNGGFKTPLQDALELLSMKDECFTCPMFKICNGCRKTIHDTKRLNSVDRHCKKMKTLANRIIDISIGNNLNEFRNV